jgi:hypothetical protein
MEPDVYGGENCDEHIPGWTAYFHGDMDGDGGSPCLELAAKTFPPGTRVIVQMPVCPECDEIQEFCDCGFDWKEWASNEYS